MKLFLIDGHALIFKIYYAFLRRPMVNSKGEDTSIIYGFTKTILELIRKESPTYFAVAFDPPVKTFRHIAYSLYKANRSATPELIKSSLSPLINIMKALNIPVIMKNGFEADDVVGTFAKNGEKNGMEVYMYTPDKDYGQLLSDNIYQYKPPKSGNSEEIIGKKEICEKYGIESAEQFIDILTIWGDTSDNIPGVQGIGEVGAKKLISKYGSIEKIYESLDSLSIKHKEAFIKAEEQLKISRFLVKIDTNVDIEFNLEELRLKHPQVRIQDIIKKYEINSLSRLLSGEFVENKLEELDIISDPNVSNQENETVSSESNSEISYSLIEFEQLIEKINQNSEKRLGIKIDISKDQGIESKISCISMCLDNTFVCQINIQNELKTESIYPQLKKLLESGILTLAGINLKQSINLLRVQDILVNANLVDIELMHYLINPERSHSLDLLTKSYLNIDLGQILNKATKEEKIDLFSVFEEVGSENKDIEQSQKEAYIILSIAGKIEKELKKEDLEKLYYDIEMPLIYVLADMEFNGVKLDINQLKEQSEQLTKELLKIEKEARDMVNSPNLNLSSPKQLGIIIYEELKLNPKVKKNNKSNYPTGEETLNELISTHPFIEKILEFRALKKLLSTYIDPLPLLVSKRSGKIHTTYNQALTSTGRLSSIKPNLQNIPIRTERGRQIRKNFISSFENGIIISADYSQIELRLMADMSKDKDMIADFNHDKDIHTSTAARVFGIKIDEVSREQRSKAKVANFGIIYGISAFGLSQRLNIDRQEAKEIISEYFNSYPGIKIYMDSMIQDAKEKGWVETIYGRKRYLPDINSKNSIVRGLAERNAINAPIQGSAADIIKLAMIELHTEMKIRGLKSKMILQVHDELVFDAIPEEVESLSNLIVNKMQNVAKLSIPLTVDCNHGKNWLEAH